MTMLTINVTTSDNLSCACCMPAEVIMCVDPLKVALENCSGVLGGTLKQKNSIPATLVGRSLVSQTSFSKVYSYQLQYESTLITAGQTLAPADVKGILCEGCLTTWVKDQVGDAVTVTTVDGVFGAPDTVQITNQYGCVFEFEVQSTPISQDGGNIIQLGTDFGLYAAPGGVAIIVSSDANNKVTPGSDGGAFLDCADIASCIGVTSGGDPVTVTEPTDGNFVVDVAVSADAGNAVTLGVDGGIYVSNAGIGGTDSVLVGAVGTTPANGSLVTHTAVDGDIKSFAAGIASISTAGDPLLGVGANFMLKNFSLAGQALLVRSGAEHTCSTAIKGMDQPFGGPYGISPVADYIRPIFLAPISFVNPSAYRSMIVCVYVDIQTTFLLENITCQRRIEASVNGGAWQLQTVVNMGLALPAGRMNFGFRDNYMTFSSVAAGGTFTFDARMHLITSVMGIGTNSWEDLMGLITIVGITI